MSDDKITEGKTDAAGMDCPAAKPLCLCGVRGCSRAAEHAASMAPQRTRTRRRWGRS